MGYGTPPGDCEKEKYNNYISLDIIRQLSIQDAIVTLHTQKCHFAKIVIWMVVWWPMHLNVSEKKGFLYSRNFQCSQIQCIVTYSYHLGEALQHWNYAKGNQLELFPGSSNLDNNRSSHIQPWQKGRGGFLGCVCVQYFTIVIRTIFRTALPGRQWKMTWQMAQFILTSFFRARFSEKNYWKRTSKKKLSILLNKRQTNKSTIECFHMTSRRPYWCPKTMKRPPCWCPKPILWEFNSFLMQTLSFVPINLHRCWPREWKHSIFMVYDNISLIDRRNDVKIYNGQTLQWNFSPAGRAWLHLSL